MAGVTVEGSTIDPNNWAPPRLGFLRRYEFGPSAIVALGGAAVVDAIEGLAALSPFSVGLGIASFAMSAGIGRLNNNDFMRKRRMRSLVVRVRDRASRMAELEQQKKANSSAYRREARAARGGLREIRRLDVGRYTVATVRGAVKLNGGPAVTIG
jgi:hypothetical protein